MARIKEHTVKTTVPKPPTPPLPGIPGGSGGGGGGGGNGGNGGCGSSGGGGGGGNGGGTSGGTGGTGTGCGNGGNGDPNCGASSAQETDKPIRYQTGGHQMPVNDLSSGGLGLTWGHTRMYNNRLGATGQVNENFGNGNNWMVRQWAYIVDPLGDDSEIVAVFSPGEAYWFLEDEEQAGEYHGQYGALHTLEHDTDGKVFKLTQPDGTIWEFYDFTQIWMSRPQGALSKVTTPGGQVLNMTYNLLGQLTTAQRTTGSGAGYIADTFEYTYIGGGGGGMQMLVATNDGNLERVTHKRKVGSSAAVNIRKVEYTYYGESEAYGLLDDLKTAKQWIWDGAWRAEGTEYYRYYTESFADEAGRRGFEHALRFIVGSQAYSEITTPESADDAVIAAKADYFFEYDSSRRVITERLGGDGADSREWTFGYEDRDGEFTEGYNVWSHKTTETRPDDSTNTVFTNYLGQVILKELDDGSNTWATHFQYGGDTYAYETARVTLRAEPSAVSSWSVDGTTKVLTVPLKPSDGLIHTYSYYSTTSGSVSPTVAGGVEGYLEYEKVKKGTGATAEALRKLEYKERTDSGVTIYLIGKETVYETGSASGTDPIVTEYHYDSWHGTHVKERRTTLPSISSGQHGSDSAAERLELFDKFGNRLAEQDERGFITTYEYDEGKGVLMKTIVDDDVPSGTSWTANSGTRLKLTTDFESDDQGRITQVLGPEHDIDGTDVRTAAWIVYKDADREVWTTQGYDDGTAKATDPKAPVTITKLNKENQPLEIIVAERYGTGRLLATETYTDQTEWARWTKHEYNETGEVNKTQVYFNIPDSGSGTLNTHYNQTEFAYDKLGNQDWVKSPGGTITRTTFDARSLATKVEIGTNDSGTGSDTMKEVTTNVYDANGNLTKETQHVDGNSANDRVTDFTYDYRNRLEKTIGEESLFQKNTYDNLDRTTQVDLHDGDGGMGQPGGTLIGRTVTAYDDRGRVYKTTRYAVDDQGDTGNTLVDKSWYDAAGNVIKSHPAGSEAFIKSVYDGAGRAVTTYVGFDTDESSHADADDVVGDTIFKQTETTYDKASNATFVIRRRRFDNEVDTNTGELGDAAGTGGKPKARVTHMATWYDEIGRQTATADYGDNGNVEMDPSTDRDASPPSSIDTRLASTIGYNDRGEAKDQTDPAGVVTRSVYDDAGRVVETLQNYKASPSNPDENVTVETEYDADGHVKKLTAVNSETGDQVTEYVYGVTLPSSTIETYDLLQKVIYPRGAATDTVTYEYNRQGQSIEMTDQNGTVHEYTYDGRGRQIEDIVTTFGGVDQTVQRIDHAYNVRGLLEKVTSYSNAVGTTVVNDVEFTYDDDKFDALMIEYQEHDTSVNTSTSPKVQYDYVGGSDDGGDTNNNNRRTKVTYPNSRILEYTYNSGTDDNLSRVSQLDFGTTGSTTTVAEYTYLGMGDFVTVNYPEPSSFDIHWNLATGSESSRYAGLDRFDRIAELLWKEHDGATDDLVKIKHGYDKASNRTYREDVAADVQSVDLDELYVYDGLHRLTAFDRGELTVGSPSTITPNFTQHWTLETTGNWEQFQQDDNGGTTWDLDQDRDHNKANEITAIAASSTHVAHDDNGNMTKVPKPSSWSAHYDLTYDAWNRLVKVEDGETTVAEYTYDGLNRRIEKTVDSVTRDFYYSDDWQTVEEQISDSPERQFVWGIRYVDDLVLRDRDDTGDLDERLYALQDANWNVVALADTAGTVQERYAYDAYGKSLVRNADFTDKATGTGFAWEYLFTGRRLDDETGMYNYRARHYNTDLGRFTGRDLIEYRGSNWNLYEYVNSMPTIYTDPYGEAWYNPFSWFGDWDDLVDQEIELVRDLNKTFGTRHACLHQFTPAERKMIEAAIKTKVDWNGPFQQSKKSYKQRETVLKGSKVCLIGAAVTDGAALGCVGTIGLANVVAPAAGMTTPEKIALLGGMLRAAREAGHGEYAAKLAAQIAALEQTLPKK